MKASLQILTFLVLCAGCSAESTVTFQPEAARSNILAALPVGWSIIPQSSQQQQETKAYFTDPRTEAFSLLGPASNYFDWTDKQGATHRDYLAKECLYIWIVPPDFTPPFPHWWTDHEPLPNRIYSSKSMRVYGLVYQHIADTNRWDAILNKECGGAISSPAIHLAWTTWKRDISASLKN